MIDIYLTRHGQTEWNVESRMQGRNNSPLTDKGIGGAKNLHNRLLSVDFAKCYTSPMPRALHTALLLIADRDVPIEIDPQLSEMDLGAWEGVKAQKAAQEHPLAFHYFRNRPDLFTPVATGETFQDVLMRAQTFLNKLKHLSDHSKPILGVTHCILLQAIMLLCDGREIATMRTGQAVDQTSLFHLCWAEDKWHVLSRNQ